MMMLSMSCQEAKDSNELATREKDRLVHELDILKALQRQQQKIKKDYQAQTAKLS